MDLKRELAERLSRVPFSMAEVARRSGLTREWVSQIARGKAKNVTTKTGEAITRALDDLAADAGGKTPEVPDHPGVRLLAADAEACRQHRVSAEELHLLAELVILRDGQPVIMESLEQALRGLDFLRSVPGPP